MFIVAVMSLMTSACVAQCAPEWLQLTNGQSVKPLETRPYMHSVGTEEFLQYVRRWQSLDHFELQYRNLNASEWADELRSADPSRVQAAIDSLIELKIAGRPFLAEALGTMTFKETGFGAGAEQKIVNALIEDEKHAIELALLLQKHREEDMRRRGYELADRLLAGCPLENVANLMRWGSDFPSKDKIDRLEALGAAISSSSIFIYGGIRLPWEYRAGRTYSAPFVVNAVQESTSLVRVVVTVPDAHAKSAADLADGLVKLLEPELMGRRGVVEVRCPVRKTIVRQLDVPAGPKSSAK